MKGKRIFLTGGSGFIGTHLVELLKDTYDITVFDIRPPSSNVNFVEGDIGDIQKITDAMSDHDIVIHLAASVGVKATEEEPIKTLNTNLLGTKNLLDACSQNNIKKIIFSSSSEVYG